jgi:HD-GYP domain-containing protein (c-di-GMP phosphodiesterase class II)
MKPLELSCITGVWKSALGLLHDSITEIGQDLQLWFPWGATWRGKDAAGSLPPTNFPEDLITEDVSRFGGRLWKAVPIGGVSWLLSVRAPVSATPEMQSWTMPEKAVDSLKMLADFLTLESLLGLSLKILENQAKEHIGHWDRVRNLSVAIGEQMGLSVQELAEIEIAAMLHDIGKVGLPADILESADRLDDEQKKIIETHSRVGAAMIKEIPGMSKIATMVLQHHEAPDGSGYPAGLKIDDIAPGSLIIAVADSFDAMTHYRPYAIERTYLESFEEMKGEDGKFAPEVLTALEAVLKRLGIIDAKPLVGNREDW